MSVHTCTPSGWEACTQCTRTDGAYDIAAGVFATTVCLTVVPVVPALVYVAYEWWGAAGGWSAMAVFYAVLPLLTGILAYVFPTRQQGDTP